MQNIDCLKHIWPEWTIMEHIGGGAYGQVYKAVCNKYATPIYSAIKIIEVPNNSSEILELKSEGFDEKALREYYRQKVKCFISEIELMETFKGTENVVNLEDYKIVERKDTIGIDIYLRMELLTPFNKFTEKKTLTRNDIIKLGVDICTALELFEQKNIIHRDIKPENILVSEDENFKIGDLGIARKLEPDVDVLSAKGTYSYMAPEIVDGKVYDIRADIYSLGIVLYKLCNNNRLPFANMDSDEIDINERKNINSRRLRGEKLPKPINADDDMAAVILHACEYNQNVRFQTPTELKKALIAVGNGEKVVLNKKNFIKIKLSLIIGITAFFILGVCVSVLICNKLNRNNSVVQNENLSENFKESFTESEQIVTESENITKEEHTNETQNDTDKETDTTETEDETEETDTTETEDETEETDTTETETVTEKETAPTETETVTEKEIAPTEAETVTNTEPEPTESESAIEKETESETLPSQDVTVEQEGFIVPEGCTYFASDRSYTEGMRVDVPVSNGHMLYTKDYVYIYREESCSIGDKSSYVGWDVRVIDSNKTEYEELLECIAGEKLVMMVCTYEDCINMKKAPKIPEGVEFMDKTYGNCDSLEDIPVIPDSVEVMYHTFESCDNLETISQLSGRVKHWEYTFSNCRKLSIVPDIPQGAYSMNGTFSECYSLKETPFIPEGVVIMNSTFFSCEQLTKVKNIPSSVTDMTATFLFCTELQTVPDLPPYVTNLNGTFSCCSKLMVAPKIPEYVRDMMDTFSNCNRLTEVSKIPDSVRFMENTFKGCMSLEKVPNIPQNVINMIGTFGNCYSLTGEIEIKANPSVYNNCFENVTFKYQKLTLTGESKMLEELYATGVD